MNSKTKKAGALVATVLIAMVVLAGIFSSGMFKKSSMAQSSPIEKEPDFPREHLFIDATYLLKINETNKNVNVTATLYLTNIWEKESGEIKAIAYVIESSNNFAIDKSTVEIRIINANSTAEIEIPVKLSNSSYKVEVLLFEKEKLVIKGKLTINAHPVYVWDEVDPHTHKKEQRLEGWSVVNTASDFVQIR
jgi:hypothetical protein